MDIFSKQKFLQQMVVFLVFLNLVIISFLVWKDHNFKHQPLLFPKNEAYRDVSNVLKNELELSSYQVQQFDAIRKKYFNKEVKLKQTIKDDKDAMNVEMFNRKTDELKILFLARRIASNEYQMELLRFQQSKELKAICTPKQQEQFENLVKEIRDYFRPDNQPVKR